MKNCPFCAEEIQDDAVKCKHCMEFLDETKRPSSTALPPSLPSSSADKQVELTWCCRTSFIVFVFLMFPPLAIPLIWLRPNLHLGWKIALTVVILLVTWVMVLAFHALMAKYTEAMEMMREMGY